MLSPLALVIFAGCYASTEPATEVGPESAKLNARGTANNGPATSWFEYWVTGTNQVKTTPRRHWPAGASAPFSEKVTGLYASRGYSFRVCGRDDSATGYLCAQTRTFTTKAAVQDSVVGYWVPSPHFTGSVDAHSGSSDPLGRIDARDQFEAFTGAVVCLHVDGSKAVVSAVGTVPGEPTARRTLLAEFVDGGPSGTDLVGVSIDAGTFPPICDNEELENLRPIDGLGDLVVNDAP